jgi:hypothetical protein
MSYKKFGLLTAIVALSGFYLHILYLAAHPTVSLAYRLYYLDGKTRFWEHNSSMIYQSGHQLNLTQPSRFLSSHGWAKKPSADGMVLTGDGGLYFLLATPAVAIKQIAMQAQIHSPVAGALLSVAFGDETPITVTLAKAGVNDVHLLLPAPTPLADPTQPYFLALSTPMPLTIASMSLTVSP